LKIYAKLLALCAFHACGTTAFSCMAPKASSSVVLKQSWSAETSSSSDPSTIEMFRPSLLKNMKTIQGGGTLVTYKLPPGSDRLQMIFKTNGRPLKAVVELWLGPLRSTHTMDIDVEDGSLTPFTATLKFKKGGEPTLKIKTKEELAFPVIAGWEVASSERSDELAAMTEKVWDANPKIPVQGGPIAGGKGAVRTYAVPANVKSVQVLFWSKDTGKKSLKCYIEVLQGADNPKQVYNLQCGGGSQPYHAVIKTPGAGSLIRIYNKKFLEDGLFECVIAPYPTV
jgi:hypothetical protein